MHETPSTSYGLGSYRAQYYRSSGRAGLARLIGWLSAVQLLVAASIVIGLIAGLALAWSLRYLGRVEMPQVLIAFFAPGSAAWVSATLFRWKGIRNGRLVAATALLAVPFLVYSAAVFFVGALASSASLHDVGWMVRLAASPNAIWDLLNDRWIKDIWVPLSMTILAGFSLVVLPCSGLILLDSAECDTCGVQMKVLRRWSVPAGNPQRLVTEVESGSFEQILPHVSGSNESDTSWNIALEQCPNCKQFSLLSVMRTRVRKRRGSIKTTRKPLVDRLILRPEWVSALAAAPAKPVTVAAGQVS